MKSVIAKTVLAVAAALSLSAQATSLMPPIDPLNLPVIELRSGGGMTAPGGMSSKKISVVRTGEVNVEEYYRGSNSVTYVLTVLDQTEMQKIVAAVGRIKTSKLTVPSGPECMDAPGVNYNIFKGGAAVTVYKRINCRTYELADKSQRADVNSIKTFLDQLDKMNRP